MKTVNKKRATIITNINKDPENEEEQEEREMRDAFVDDLKFDVNKMASKLLLGKYI